MEMVEAGEAWCPGTSQPGDGGGYQWRGLWCGGPQLDFKYATGLAVSVLSGNDCFLEARGCLCADASLSLGKDRVGELGSQVVVLS